MASVTTSACRAPSSSLSSFTSLAGKRATLQLAAIAVASQVRRPSAVRAEVTDSDAKVAASPVKAPDGFVAPEPKPFSVAEGQLGAVAASAIAPLLRLGTGVFAAGYQASLKPAGELSEDEYALGPFMGYRLVETSKAVKQAEQPIVLYEFEGCPFCRKVREMVSYLSLDVLFYPTPVNGPTYRPEAIKIGGKKQFPYMVDPNTGVSMYESDEIIKYLADTYGDGTVPVMLRLGPLTSITAGLAGIGRATKGSRYVTSRKPPQPLQVWAYEPSPFCKLVREALCELEIPHVYHATPRGSAKRAELKQRIGTFQAPYLEDPNTGVAMFESKAIVQYLYSTYALENKA